MVGWIEGGQGGQKLNQFSLNWKSLRSLTDDWISFLLSTAVSWRILHFFATEQFLEVHKLYQNDTVEKIDNNSLLPVFSGHNSNVICDHLRLFVCDWCLCDCNPHPAIHWLQNEFLFWLRRWNLLQRAIAFRGISTTQASAWFLLKYNCNNKCKYEM